MHGIRSRVPLFKNIGQKNLMMIMMMMKLRLKKTGMRMMIFMNY
jgi:hypothetical protein